MFILRNAGQYFFDFALHQSTKSLKRDIIVLQLSLKSQMSKAVKFIIPCKREGLYWQVDQHESEQTDNI